MKNNRKEGLNWYCRVRNRDSALQFDHGGALSLHGVLKLTIPDDALRCVWQAD